MITNQITLIPNIVDNIVVINSDKVLGYGITTKYENTHSYTGLSTGRLMTEQGINLLISARKKEEVAMSAYFMSQSFGAG